jgi:hypothetical protein
LIPVHPVKNIEHHFIATGHTEYVPAATNWRITIHQAFLDTNWVACPIRGNVSWIDTIVRSDRIPDVRLQKEKPVRGVWISIHCHLCARCSAPITHLLAIQRNVWPNVQLESHSQNLPWQIAIRPKPG